MFRIFLTAIICLGALVLFLAIGVLLVGAI